ncbi:hypothetical protein PS1M3_20450 [Pseudoalteromonas sp. PS1M3]|nr:hypothetical protein PS1M3_20450 [Pseudoalteromonas sp. PS1M3]
MIAGNSYVVTLNIKNKFTLKTVIYNLFSQTLVILSDIIIDRKNELLK